MKKAFIPVILTVMLLLHVLSLTAQSARRIPSPDTIAAREAAFMKDKLSLDEATTDLARRVIKENSLSMDKLRSVPDAAERKASSAEIRRKYLDDLKRILTPAQYARYMEIIEEGKKLLERRAYEQHKQRRIVNERNRSYQNR